MVLFQLISVWLHKKKHGLTKKNASMVRKSLIFLKSVVETRFQAFREYMSFGKSLMVMDAFKAHFTDSVKLAMTIGNTATIQVHGGSTSKVQPLDV